MRWGWPSEAAGCVWHELHDVGVGLEWQTRDSELMLRLAAKDKTSLQRWLPSSSSSSSSLLRVLAHRVAAFNKRIIHRSIERHCLLSSLIHSLSQFSTVCSRRSSLVYWPRSLQTKKEKQTCLVALEVVLEVVPEEAQAGTCRCSLGRPINQWAPKLDWPHKESFLHFWLTYWPCVLRFKWSRPLARFLPLLTDFAGCFIRPNKTKPDQEKRANMLFSCEQYLLESSQK